MKKYMNVLRTAGIMLAIVLAGPVHAQNIVPNAGALVQNDELSDEDIADGFARYSAKYWRADVQFLATTNGVSTIVLEHFTLEWKSGRWGITQLQIGDRNIPIDPDHPLWELPAYGGEVTQFNLWANGYDAQGKNTRYGGFFAPVLGPNDGITIQINLSSVAVQILYTLPAGYAASSVIIVTDDGRNQGWYDAQRGEFVINIDPLNPPKSFLIIDQRNNSVIGTVGSGGQNSGGSGEMQQAHGIAMSIPGGTLESSFGPQDWLTSFHGLSLDQRVTRSQNEYRAKIAILHASQKSDYVQAYAYGVVSGSVLEVWGVKEDGSLAFLKQVQTGGDGWSTIVNDATGYLTYKIVLIGVTTDPIGGASLDFYRSAYPWGDSNGKR